MAKVDMFSKLKMEADLVVSGNSWVSPPKMSFKVAVDIDDKTFKQVKSDGILLENMNEAVQKVYDQTCEGIKSKLKAFDKLVQVMVDKNAPQGEIDKQLDGLNKSIEQDRKVAETASEKAAMDCWTKYAAKKKEYLKYGIKVTATIVGTAAGLATSIGLTAAGGFTGGASAFFGMLGMVKSTITLVKEIGSAWIEVDRADDPDGANRCRCQGTQGQRRQEGQRADRCGVEPVPRHLAALHQELRDPDGDGREEAARLRDQDARRPRSPSTTFSTRKKGSRRTSRRKSSPACRSIRATRPRTKSRRAKPSSTNTLAASTYPDTRTRCHWPRPNTRPRTAATWLLHPRTFSPVPCSDSAAPAAAVRIDRAASVSSRRWFCATW